MDGTIYLGKTLFEGVSCLLENIEKNGGRYVETVGLLFNDEKMRMGTIFIIVENFYTNLEKEIIKRF